MSGDQKTVIKGNPSQYVKLNVGGSLHYTTIGTLTKHDTMLRAMFSGRMEVLTDSEGKIKLCFLCITYYSCSQELGLCSGFDTINLSHYFNAYECFFYCLYY